MPNQLNGKWFTGKIEDLEWSHWNPTAALINPVRLLEMADNTEVRHILDGISQTFLYTYSDHAANFASICEQAQLPVRQLLHIPTISAGILVKS